MSVGFFGWRAFFGPAERGETAVLRFGAATCAAPFLGGLRAFCGVCFGAGFHGVQPVSSTFIACLGFARFVWILSLTRLRLPCCKQLPLHSQRRFCCGSYAQYHRVFSVASQAKHGSPASLLSVASRRHETGLEDAHHRKARMPKSRNPKTETQTRKAESRVVPFSFAVAGTLQEGSPGYVG